MTKIRIFIADDHEIVRRGLRATLEAEPDVELIGEASNGREAVTRVNELQPDIVVMDVGMPELNGLEATRQIRAVSPSVRVLILTVHESEQVVREVLDAGAQGYLLKSDAGRDLVHAVRALIEDKPFFTSKVARMVLQGFLRRPAGNEEKEPSTATQLSMREREIVQLLAEGKSNKEVAQLLGISVKTAETHRTNIMRKLEMHSITDLVRYAIRNKMVEP
jgi:DNA-binding NarL/FixJ family response regulator